MTQETPAKVFSLLGTAMFSLLFLFAVSSTNASFTQTENVFPDVFNPEKIVMTLDNISSSYSRFVDVYLVQSGRQSYAIGMDNINYVIEEASPAILSYTGLQARVDQSSYAPQVAGAFNQVVVSEYYKSSPALTFNMDTVYSVLFAW